VKRDDDCTSIRKCCAVGEDFARLIREQGIAANATPRVARGRNKGKTRDAIYRAQHHGTSDAIHRRATEVAEQLTQTGAYRDPLRNKLPETRKAVVSHWLQIAETLDRQGESVLASDVRHFARYLPPVLTDNEASAVVVARHVRTNRPESVLQENRLSIERTR
jgi:hypothetical protein